jgi:hypothetical protein
MLGVTYLKVSVEEQKMCMLNTYMRMESMGRVISETDSILNRC